MKIRSGFVSNSSSSSFVILGDSLNRLPSKFEKGIWAIGEDFGEGSDVFELTKKMFDFLSKNVDKCYANFAFVQGIPANEGEEIERKNLPTRFSVYSFEVSYHSTDSLESLIEHYFPEEPNDSANQI